MSETVFNAGEFKELFMKMKNDYVCSALASMCWQLYKKGIELGIMELIEGRKDNTPLEELIKLDFSKYNKKIIHNAKVLEEYKNQPEPKLRKNYNPVSNPSHYCEGRKYEPKDVIRNWDLNFNLGCAVKYLSRAGRKGDKIEDLEKAKQYIQFEIDYLRKELNKNDI